MPLWKQIFHQQNRSLYTGADGKHLVTGPDYKDGYKDYKVDALELPNQASGAFSELLSMCVAWHYLDGM